MSDRTAATAQPALSTAEGSPAAVEAAVAAYFESWNETDPARRQAAIARSWGARVHYRDPLMASDDHAGLDAVLAAVQARFPGFVMKRISPVDAHNGSARFAWSLGPASGPTVVEGVDFCALDAEGRLESVVGFIDKMPA